MSTVKKKIIQVKSKEELIKLFPHILSLFDNNVTIEIHKPVRKKYEWGKMKLVADMEKGENITAYINDTKSYAAWRQALYKYGKDFGRYYSVSRMSENYIMIKRIY